jgi:hypothetical protein
MDDFSRLSGAVPIAPVSNRVWGLQKKRKPGDRKRRNRKEEDGTTFNREADQGSTGAEEAKDAEAVENQAFEGEIGYGSSGEKKKISRKIDLVI